MIVSGPFLGDFPLLSTAGPLCSQHLHSRSAVDTCQNQSAGCTFNKGTMAEPMRVAAEVCPTCDGTGWKPSSGVDGRVSRCDCRLQARTQGLLENARIPKRYEHCELSNFEF